MLRDLRSSREALVGVVYALLFLDNMLLTVVVPIVPDLLQRLEAMADGNSSRPAADENGRVGALLSSKALVQLVVSPAVGRLGHRVPLLAGCTSLLVASLVFAFSQQYYSLLAARSLQGVASACIGVSGMSLVAEQYQEQAARSRVMGVVLGSVALGVLVGYPFGGLLYDFVGKMAPFLVIAALAFLNGVVQLLLLDMKSAREHAVSGMGITTLLADGMVLAVAGAIWLSTSAMAVLEPCLPIWLMDTLRPQKWQLGMVFIPDSLGYLLGTNCFGGLAYRLGQWKVAVAAMMLVGVSAFSIPSARAVSQLAVPHFGLGLGIGVVDAALVPLLASLVDCRYGAHYGAVYALQQTAVSLAYCLGPLAGGELVRALGFPWLMRGLGAVTVLYCPLLAAVGRRPQGALLGDASAVNYQTAEDGDSGGTAYRRFLGSDTSN
ncbi:synaptic vesicular amine transporter-like [Bacillus rossius redtenbacheri]|uniref:synaptic vesicular amine transporter-like n=1 Tax=Bacillus rossius redtenbacheri TaxID=93214 RepID=UPI002FDDCF33